MTQLTVQPSAKDTNLREAFSTTNYGSETGIATQGGTDQNIRGILEFDISSLPAGAIITFATLYLYYYEYVIFNPSGKTIWAYKLSRTDWVEAEATWDEYS